MRTIRAAIAVVGATVLCVGVLGAGAAAAGGRSVLPDGFRAQAISFVSADRGWILGTQPCGGANCTNVLRTIDGGDTWKKIGRIHAPLTYDKLAGVTEVRFSDALHGWAFGPSLWSTVDGGATWTKEQVPGGGNMVPLVAADAQAAYAVVSQCALNQTPSSCPVPSLWKTTPSDGSWTKTLTLAKGLVTNTARMSLFGGAGYLIVPRESETIPDYVRGTRDGVAWSPRPDPCDGVDESLVDVTATSETNVSVACVSDPGFSHSGKRVFRSTDRGHTWKSFGAIPFEGIVTQMAASPNGRLELTSWGAAGSWIYRSNGGHAWSTVVDSPDNGVGWNDVVMASDQVGFVVHGPAALFPGNRPGELGETTNGGGNWHPV